eukprot:402872_1
MGNRHSTTRELYVVGDNYNGWLGLGHFNFAFSKKGHSNNVKELKKWNNNNMKIDCLYIGDRFAIFKNNKNKYFACGYNDNGQCAVDSSENEISQLTKITYFM